MSELPAIKKLLIGLAEFYGEAMTPTRLALLANALADLRASDLELAIGECTRDPSVTRMPLPAKLRSIVRPASNPEAEALDAAHRIWAAVSRIGHGNPELAKAYIGALGWKVVEREGGWENLCVSTLTSQGSSIKAQWRELAKAIHTRAMAGVIDNPPGLPLPPRQESSLEPIERILNVVSGGRNANGVKSP